MPLLVRTPEEIFRIEKKDLYILRSREEVENNAPGLEMIQQWIRENLPGTGMELLAPSEYSGMLCGGIGEMVRVDFSPSGLQVFCDRWEVNNDSVDERFQCYIHPYKRWYEKHGQFVPTREKPKGKGPIVWVYTPLGFVHHQFTGTVQTTKRLNCHPANAADIWMHVADLWPELSDCKYEALTHGHIYTDQAGLPLQAIFNPPFFWSKEPSEPQPTTDQIRSWFNLPEQIPVLEDDF